MNKTARNFRNLAIVAGFISFFYLPDVFHWKFAYPDSPEENSNKLRNVEGIFVVKNVGFRTRGFCVIDRENKKTKACIDISRTITNTPRDFVNGSATGYAIDGLGVVELNVNGKPVVLLDAARHDIQDRILKFIVLTVFWFAMLMGFIFSRDSLPTQDRN